MKSSQSSKLNNFACKFQIVIIIKNCLLFLSDLTDLSDFLILKNPSLAVSFKPRCCFVSWMYRCEKQCTVFSASCARTSRKTEEAGGNARTPGIPGSPRTPWSTRTKRRWWTTRIPRTCRYVILQLFIRNDHEKKLNFLGFTLFKTASSWGKPVCFS